MTLKISQIYTDNNGTWTDVRERRKKIETSSAYNVRNHSSQKWKIFIFLFVAHATFVTHNEAWSHCTMKMNDISLRWRQKCSACFFLWGVRCWTWCLADCKRYIRRQHEIVWLQRLDTDDDNKSQCVDEDVESRHWISENYNSLTRDIWSHIIRANGWEMWMWKFTDSG